MKLVAVVRTPTHPEDAAGAVASATGLTRAEARMRLAPEPPALVARLPPDRADRLVAELRRAGLAAVAVEEPVPSDAARTVARTCSFGAAAAAFVPRSGPSLSVPWSEVTAILRGTRSARSDVERTEKQKRFSVGTALATGGLLVSRTSAKTVRASEESFEQVILVYARDGRAALLSEEELDFACLGPALQPARTANMTELARQLRERARGALYDERLQRLGRRPLPFVAAQESRLEAAGVAVTRVDSSRSLDVLAELLRRALAEGLLP